MVIIGLLRNKNDLLCFSFLLMLALLFHSCSKDPDIDGDPDVNNKNWMEASAEDIIQKYAEETKAEISQTDIDDIESYCGQFPLNAGAGIAPVLVEENADMGTILMPDINQRDWAYAYLGIQYTLAGIFLQGQEYQLTKALWCFLEAASLNPDEPEHYANIAFHLNGKEAYYDALIVLMKAKSIQHHDSINVMACNNMAYAYAAVKDPTMALIEMNNALSQWPDNEFLLEKVNIYSEGMNDSESNYADVIGMGCSEVGNIEIYPPELSTDQLSTNGLMYYQKLISLIQEYIVKFSELPWYECPASLEDIMDLWQQIASLRDNRSDCYSTTENAQLCDKCDKPYETALHNMALYVSGDVITVTQQWQTRSLKLAAEYRERIFSDIRQESSINENDRNVFLAYWEEYFLYESASIWEISISNMCYAKDFERSYRPQLSCYTYEVPPVILPFGGKISIWVGLGSISIDANKGEAEIQFGQGWQGSIGWNWKTNTPTLGIGYGVNLDKLIQPGAFIRYTPGKGLVGSVDISPATEFILPGASAPSIPIAKLGAFMN